LQNKYHLIYKTYLKKFEEGKKKISDPDKLIRLSQDYKSESDAINRAERMMRLNTMLTITVCSLVSSIFLNLLFFGVILQLALLIIGFLGVVIGAIVIAMFLPILTLTQAIH